jgi:predicted ATPase/DNA-binding SARP family transcriptional activator
MLSVSVLGPVEVSRDGGPVPIRSGKTAEVLIRLALDAGVLVRTERLIEDLWGEAAVETQKNTLQATVSRLRRALGDASLVTGARSGYTLEVDAGAVDALEVVRLAASASELLDRGDPAAALATATGALTLFRGEVLCDAGDGEWLLPHRSRLDEVRLHLVEDQFAARLELGAAGEVTGELEALVATHPLRERMWELLVTALYRDGRQAEALAAYTRVRDLLAEELGLEPGPALRALEHQVLEQDPRLERSRAPGAAPGNVPPLSSSLVGRTHELEEIVELLDRQRLVTLVGAAGVGKTRVAIEVARTVERVAGAWFVRLEGATSAAAVTEAVTAALALPGGTESMLFGHLRGSDALLVLDNCEHVVDAVAELVPRILAASARVTVLCTSQVPLGVDGEWIQPLEPLAIADSVELFALRAGEHRTSFVLDDGTAAGVRELCSSLDGLPLAIELAAARTKTLSVDDIARRLDDRFALLRDPGRRRPERQRALAAAIAWSHDLLFPDDQRGLWALASFVDGVPLAAGEHVIGALGVPAASALDVVDRLVDRSLVSVDVGARDVGDGADDRSYRYRMLDSVRAFGLDRLREAGLADAAAGAHASWFGDAAGIVDEEVRGPRQARHLTFVRVERANIDAALAWAVANDPQLAVRIVNGFGWAWVVAGDGALGAERFRTTLDAVGDRAPAADRAIGWSITAWLEAGNSVARAHVAAEHAILVADAAGDDTVAAVSRLALAFVLIQEARAREALDLLEGCCADFRRLGRVWDEGAAWVLSASAALLLGDAVLAANACAHAEALVRPLGDDWGLGHLDSILGRVARAELRSDDAIRHLSEAADAAGRLGFATSEGYHLANLGRVHQQAGDPEQAIVALERVLEIGRATAELRLVALGRVTLGAVLREIGDDDGARAQLGAADDWFRASGGGAGAAVAACLLAAMDAVDGVDDATTRLIDLLDAARAADDIEVEVRALDALARARAKEGETTAAIELLDAADARLLAAPDLLGDADRLDARAARSLIESARPPGA